MYLWVYNHHIAVYMDFVTEFYIKHMAANFEARNKYKDKIDLYKLFSCHAISDLLVSDSDLKCTETRLNFHEERVNTQLILSLNYFIGIFKTIVENNI